MEAQGQQAAGDHLPARRLLAGELHGRADERRHAGVRRLAGCGERVVARGQMRHSVNRLGEVALDAQELGLQSRRGLRILRHGAGQLRAHLAQLGATMAVEDVALGGLERAQAHERALDLVLDVLDAHRAGVRGRGGGGSLGQGRLHQLHNLLERALLGHLARIAERAAHRRGDLLGPIRLHAPIALFDPRDLSHVRLLVIHNM